MLYIKVHQGLVPVACDYSRLKGSYMKVMGHLNLVYDYNILQFMVVVREAPTDNVLLTFAKKSGRANALSALQPCGSSGPERSVCKIQGSGLEKGSIVFRVYNGKGTWKVTNTRFSNLCVCEMNQVLDKQGKLCSFVYFQQRNLHKTTG